MSTLDNSQSLNDSLLQTENKLLHAKSKVDLKLYEKNSMNKINFRSFLGKNYLCSSQDKYRKIRVPITALLLKILENRNQKNTQRMQKIKRLIYSSHFQDIVKTQGITAQSLLSNFALVINQLQTGSQIIQTSLIKRLNTEPFFDKIIMESFYERFYDPSQQLNLTAGISKWIKKQLGISIIFVQNQTQLQTDSLIYLRKNEKHQVLCRLKSFHISSMTSVIDENDDNITPIKKTNKQFNFNQSETLLTSISSIRSPTVRISQKQRQNQQLVPISLQTSLELLDVTTKYLNQQGYENSSCNQPITKRKAQKSQSRLWKIFCCGAD